MEIHGGSTWFFAIMGNHGDVVEAQWSPIGKSSGNGPISHRYVSLPEGTFF